MKKTSFLKKLTAMAATLAMTCVMAVGAFGDSRLGDLGKAAVRQCHGAGAGHHGLIGDRANAIRGLVADLLEHALLVGHAGAVGNVLAAKIPVVHAAV